jgi:hypothetical protein
MSRRLGGFKSGVKRKKLEITVENQKRMAVEAVIGEPVSASHFPVSRENTGKFADFGLETAKAPLLSEANSIACQRNSLVTKAGKICWRSGNLQRATANLIRT